MFDDLKIKKKKVRKYLLKYYDSRGTIISILKEASKDCSL